MIAKSVSKLKDEILNLLFGVVLLVVFGVWVDKIWFGDVPEHFIAWGESPRPKKDGRPKQHCVVVSRKGYGVKVTHDPHPDRTGLKTMCGFCFIVRSAPHD